VRPLGARLAVLALRDEPPDGVPIFATAAQDLGGGGVNLLSILNNFSLFYLNYFD
jgi:hypothetical protein